MVKSTREQLILERRTSRSCGIAVAFTAPRTSTQMGMSTSAITPSWPDAFQGRGAVFCQLAVGRYSRHATWTETQRSTLPMWRRSLLRSRFREREHGARRVDCADRPRPASVSCALALTCAQSAVNVRAAATTIFPPLMSRAPTVVSFWTSNTPAVIVSSPFVAKSKPNSRSGKLSIWIFASASSI